jgi:flagellar motility protein MotE (MotC chaperone)
MEAVLGNRPLRDRHHLGRCLGRHAQDARRGAICLSSSPPPQSRVALADDELAQENKKILEATTDEKVLILEQRREHLVKQKKELDDKLADLHARMKARESGLSGRG